METKVMVVTNVKKGANSTRRVPRITLSGDWLSGIGFESGKLATAQYDHGSILLRLHDAQDYRDLVRGAFKDGSGLFQVHGRSYKGQKMVSRISLLGVRLETLGFSIGSHVLLRYEYGMIKITLLDLSKVG